MIELLVVLAIISILVALLLPGVLALREAARRTQCQENLRQIALALMGYHDNFGEFPPGGWGHKWVGVPDRGSGRQQPGGWIYSILPFVEEEELYQLGIGLSDEAAEVAYSSRISTAVPLFNCPTRRSSSTWSIPEHYPWVIKPKPYGEASFVARADYAINGGTSHVFSFSGPSSIDQGSDAGFWRDAPRANGFSGISHLRISTSMRSIIDGLSQTYLVGEKYLEPNSYFDGSSLGDNESLYAGYCTDLHRFAGIEENIKLSRPPYVEPLHDSQTTAVDIPGYLRFGSAHPSGFNMTRCDGSVLFVAFDIDPIIHFRRGNRKGQDDRL